MAISFEYKKRVAKYNIFITKLQKTKSSVKNKFD